MSDAELLLDAAKWRMHQAAEQQRQAAVNLHKAVAVAREAGISWTAIGEAIGLPRETVFRQWNAGDVVVVIQGKQRKADE